MTIDKLKRLFRWKTVEKYKATVGMPSLITFIVAEVFVLQNPHSSALYVATG